MKKLLAIVLLLALATASGAGELAESENTGCFAFGFRENDSSTLMAKFNDAILSMKLDGTITILQAKYLYGSGAGDSEAVNFRNYDTAETIRIALTEETRTYFNLAVLADINRRLRVNVELLNVRTDEQIPALICGNVDAVLLHTI